MKYYGKTRDQFTSDEMNLLKRDISLMTSTELNDRGQTICLHGVELGSDDDVLNRYMDRHIFVAKMMGYEIPRTTKGMDEMILKIENETPYGIIRFMKQHFENRREIMKQLGEQMGQLMGIITKTQNPNKVMLN